MQDGCDNGGPLVNSFSLVPGGRVEFVDGAGHTPYPHNSQALLPDGTLSVEGPFAFKAAGAGAATPDGLGQIPFQRLSDTSLSVRMMGLDGVVRSVALTLA